MRFVQSMPWPYKVAILLLFLYQPIRINSFVLPAERCLHAVALYMLVTALPSMVYTVKCRTETTCFIQMSALVMMNAYVMFHVLWTKKEAQGCLDMALLFVCVHTLVVQREFMRTKKTVLLLSGLYSHTHQVAVCLVVLSASLLNNDLGSITLHTSICILAAVFAGEVLSCIAYVNYVLFKTIGNMWEGVWL